MSPTIVIFSFSPLARDPRVLRQLEIIKEASPGAKIITVGLGEAWSELVEHHQIFGSAALAKSWRLVLFGRSGNRILDFSFGEVLAKVAAGIGFHSYFFKRISRVKEADNLLRKIRETYDVSHVIGNDFDCLPLLKEHFGGDMVFLDSHEFTPNQSLSASLGKAVVRRHKRWLVRSTYYFPAKMSTVSEGIRQEYLREFGTREIGIWPNAPRPITLGSSKAVSKPIRLVHHGLGTRPRQLERMVQTLQDLGDGYELHFYLVNLDPQYRVELETLASKDALFFHEPVATSDLSTELSQYDVGVFLHEPKSVNAKYMLPNKFFEFVNAGLAVATGPAVEMATISTKQGFGIVSDDFEPSSLASKLRNLPNEEISRKKLAARAYAGNLEKLYQHESFLSFLFKSPRDESKGA